MQRMILKKGYRCIFCVLFAGTILSWLAYQIDCDQIPFWQVAEYNLPPRVWTVIASIKYSLYEYETFFYNFVITMGTILTAVVVLYYSVQDSRREGIPRRKITAYRFGSLTIPVMFFTQLFCMFGITIIYALGLMNWVYTGLLYIFGIQVWIISMIMRASSFNKSCNIIYQTEKRQFHLLFKYNNISDRQYIWSYLIHHMEQVADGEQMLFDRMTMTKKLLSIPYDAKRIHKFVYYNPYMEDRWQWMAHEYYFCNIVASAAKLPVETRDAFLNVLLEFLSNKSSTLSKAESLKEKKEASKEPSNKREMNKNVKLNKYMIMETDYFTTVSSVMLSILYSDFEQSERFCIHILNEMSNIGNLRPRILFLYFLVLEFLYRTKLESCHLKDFSDIQNLDEAWNHGMDEAELIKYYLDYWLAWSKVVSIPEVRSRIYYRNAIKTLLGKSKQSVLMSYIYSMCRTEDSKHENKNITVNE